METVAENISNIKAELSEILGYKIWDKFLNVIKKSKEACSNSGNDLLDHFSHVGKMVQLGSGSKRKIEDIMLSRYACYLIVQNADPNKEEVALGQTYFAIKTRQQELQEDFEDMDEERILKEKKMQIQPIMK